jgi:TRAP-type C4-dicarboxylate transport system permease small subunit
MGARNYMKFWDKLFRMAEVLTFLSIVSAFIMVCLTAVDAMGRYFLNQPITGVYEIEEKYLMVFLVYFAFAYAYREGANIRVTFLVDRFPLKVQSVIRYIVQIFSFLYIVFLFLSATQVNLGRLADVVDLTRRFGLPMWPAYLIISICLLFLSLLVFLDLWQIKNGKSGLFKEESSQEPSSM